MAELSEETLSDLARTAAAAVYGLDAVKNVQVKTGEDYTGRPMHHFTFLVERDRGAGGGGMMLIRLSQNLRDELMAHDDEHYPYVSVLDRADWEKVVGA